VSKRIRPKRVFRPELIDPYHKNKQHRFYGSVLIPFNEEIDELIYVWQRVTERDRLFLSYYKKNSNKECIYSLYKSDILQRVSYDYNTPSWSTLFKNVQKLILQKEPNYTDYEPVL
jgi:hypothetical protein